MGSYCQQLWVGSAAVKISQAIEDIVLVNVVGISRSDHIPSRRILTYGDPATKLANGLLARKDTDLYLEILLIVLAKAPPSTFLSTR